MTRTEHLLICLAEECAEVANRVTKALRFGLGEVQEGQAENNVARINQELCDLVAVIYMLEPDGVKLPLMPDLLRLNIGALSTKIKKVEYFMGYAEKIGLIN